MYSDAHYESYYGVSVITPRSDVIHQLRLERESFTRSIIDVGSYSDKRIINETIKKVYGFLDDCLKGCLKQAANINTLCFLLDQYTQTLKIDWMSRRQFDDDEQERWNNRMGLRRGLKYVIEKIVEHGICDKNDGDSLNLERMIELAEMCVEFSSESSLVYGLPEGRFEMTINPPGSRIYCDMKIENFAKDALQDSLYRFREFVEQNGRVEDDSEKNISERITTPFSETFHFPYADVKRIYEFFANYKKVVSNEYVLVSKNLLLNELLNTLKIKTDLSKMELFLNAFILSRQKLIDEPRELFRTNQKYRLRLRFMLEFDIGEKKMIAYSRAMVAESNMAFQELFLYDSLPDEWKFKKMEKATSSILNYYGHKFERYANGYLAHLGLIGQSYKDNLPSGIPIPRDVGEIDFIGFSQEHKIIACFEFKNVKGSTEPRQFRNDLDKFIYDKESYLVKYRKKVKFVSENIDSLAAFFEQTVGIKMNTDYLITAIITYYPNISRYFISDYKCLSIADFETEYESNLNQFLTKVEIQ